MGFLILLVALVLAGLMFAAFAGLGLFAAADRMRAKAIEQAPQTLDATFGPGAPDDVVVKLNLETMPYEMWVLGAKDRGFDLAHEHNDTAGGEAKTLIFRRRAVAGG